MILQVEDAGGGVLVATVENDQPEAVVLPHAPVVGLRAVAHGGGWRGACKIDPATSRTPLRPGQRSRWSIGWADALRRADGSPAPGEYDVQVVFRVAAAGPVTISQPVACSLGHAAAHS